MAFASGGPHVRRAERVEIEKQRARARHQAQKKRARENVSDFIEYAIRSEQDGSRLENATFHREWQEHLDQNQYAGLIAPVEHAKSQQISVGRVLFQLGKNPNLRIAIISNTSKQAEKILRQIRTEIERNPRIREVFPHLKRSTRDEDPWHSTQITIERATISKDPSIQVCGVFGPIVGSRLDLIVLDDVLDFENTRTEEQRKKLIEWIDTTVITRLVKHGRMNVIGTPWHPDDLLHELSTRTLFKFKRYAAVENPDDPAQYWRPIWPEQWDLKRLLERRSITPETTFARKYLCRVRLDETSRFRQVWLDRMCQLGKGRTFLARAPKVHVRGAPLPCFTGVDLGIGQGEEHARTVIFTIALLPDGRRLIVDIESGRWQAPEIVDRIASAFTRYDSTIFVENNGAQQFIVDMCQGRVPVIPFTTGKNKHSEEFGVETLAVEIRNGWWLMPSGTSGESVPEEGKAFMTECLYYDPTTHTGDRLMAAWLAREALRKYSKPRARRLPTLHR